MCWGWEGGGGFLGRLGPGLGQGPIRDQNTQGRYESQLSEHTERPPAHRNQHLQAHRSVLGVWGVREGEESGGSGIRNLPFLARPACHYLLFPVILTSKKYSQSLLQAWRDQPDETPTPVVQEGRNLLVSKADMRGAS